MALSGIPIDQYQCIGDSLVVLNNSFIELDSRTLNLSSGVLGLQTVDKLKFTATGDTTYNASSLIGPQTNAYLYRVDINGVSQEPGTNVTDGDFYLSGGNLFFSTAPIIGTKIVMVGPQYI